MMRKAMMAGGAEAERLEARGREQQRQHRAGDHDDRAAQRELQRASGCGRGG